MSDPIIPIDNATVWDQLDDQNKVIDEMKSERDTLRARVAELEATCAGHVEIIGSLAEVIRLKPEATCASLHHEKADRHEIGEPCKPLQRVSEAQQKAIRLLSTASTAGASLLARLKELEQDKARMDWLLDHADISNPHNSSESWGIREAIDAAMAKGDA